MMKNTNVLPPYAPAWLTPSLRRALIVLEAECKLCGASFAHDDNMVKVHVSAPHGELSARIDLAAIKELTALCRIDSIVETLREGYRL